MVLDQLGPLLLDEDRALPELRVVRAVELGDAALDRLGLDARLRRVVHAAGEVAVRRDLGDPEIDHEFVILSRTSCPGAGRPHRTLATLQP